MATYAVINNGVVENIIVADDQQEAERATGKQCVNYDPLAVGSLPHIGLGYDGTTFEQPPVTLVDVKNPDLLEITPGQGPIEE